MKDNGTTFKYIIIALASMTTVSLLFLAVFAMNTRQMMSKTNAMWTGFNQGNMNGGERGGRANVTPRTRNTNFGGRRDQNANAAPADCNLCDVNKDGVVDKNDAAALFECAQTEVVSKCPAADANHDGKVDKQDIAALKQEYLNGTKTKEELEQIASCVKSFKNDDGTVNTKCGSDVNGDGVKDKNDIVSCVMSCAAPDTTTLPGGAQ